MFNSIHEWKGSFKDHKWKIVICNMCVDDWNIDHRWGQKMSSLGGPTLNKIVCVVEGSRAKMFLKNKNKCCWSFKGQTVGQFSLC